MWLRNPQWKGKRSAVGDGWGGWRDAKDMGGGRTEAWETGMKETGRRWVGDGDENARGEMGNTKRIIGILFVIEGHCS